MTELVYFNVFCLLPLLSSGLQSNNVIRTRYLSAPASLMATDEKPYILENQGACAGMSRVNFLLVIHSATYHFDRRMAIRETWGNVNLFKNEAVLRIFLLGDPVNRTLQYQINSEQSAYGDIVQGNFVDTYHNLTHKAVLGLRWMTEHCPNVAFVVKADDDIFVNTLYIFDYAKSKFTGQSRRIWCPLKVNNSAVIFRSGRWSVADDEFKGMKRYPFPLCMGYAAVVTGDVIPELYRASQNTPFFWIDDVYLYGMLAEVIGSVTHGRLPGLNPFDEGRTLRCIRQVRPCTLFFTKAYSDETMNRMWLRSLTEHYKAMTKTQIKDEVLKDWKSLLDGAPTEAWSNLKKVFILTQT